MDIYKSNGITTEKDERYETKTFCISDALEEENPRNMFLNGHLYIEMECDSILLDYFCKQSNGVIIHLFNDLILKSESISFFMKIKILSKLVNIRNLENFGSETSIDQKIIKSLKAINIVRNIFAHNLDYDDAMKKVGNNNDGNFQFVQRGKQKPLKGYSSLEELLKDFKVECCSVYEELGDIRFLSISEIPDYNDLVGKTVEKIYFDPFLREVCINDFNCFTLPKYIWEFSLGNIYPVRHWFMSKIGKALLKSDIEELKEICFFISESSWLQERSNMVIKYFSSEEE